MLSSSNDKCLGVTQMCLGDRLEGVDIDIHTRWSLGEDRAGGAVLKRVVIGDLC